MLLSLAFGTAGACAACGSDSVAYIEYGDGGGAVSATSPGSDGSSSASSGADGGGASDSGPGANRPSSARDGGMATCDMSGSWLAVQHTVANSDDFKEVSHVYLYYELSQAGTIVTVIHGYHCGLTVTKDPNNLLGGGDNVSFSAAGTAALLARQDEGQSYGGQPARTGTMTTTSSGCQFHLGKYYVVRGATLPYYVNPSETMSATMPEASSCGTDWSDCQTPGWEDWDDDGYPGITLNVSGTATGDIYAAQRDFSEYNGTVPLGATQFEVGVVDSSGAAAVDPEQYALGTSSSCGALCTLSSTVDTCPSSADGGCSAEFFVDWVNLGTPPASTPTAICNSVLDMAEADNLRATSPDSVPTMASP